MKKIIPFFLAVLFIVFSFGACRTQNNKGEYPVTIGNVIIPEQPKKIVCMSDSIADIAIACGYSSKLAARSEECDQNAIFPLPTVGSNEHPDIDAIINMDCDLVFADELFSDDAKTSLNDAGINVLSITKATTRDELSRMYSNICAAFEGNETGRKSGEKKIENLYTSIDELERQIPNSDVINTSCYVYDIEAENVVLCTGESFASKLIEYSGAVNIGAGSIDSLMDKKTFKMQNPKYIFCAPGVKEKMLEDEDLSKLYALSEDNVFVLEESAVRRQGNTILSTVEFMVKAMYPQLSGDGQNDSEETDTDELNDSDSETQSDTDENKNTDSQTSNASDTSSSNGTIYIVNSDDGLKLRSSPDKSDNIILSMADKDKVELLEDLGNGWFKVKTQDGTTGYCSSEFLVKNEP